MVVTFTSIPQHIKKTIIEKMNFNDFQNFLESSKDARNSSQAVKVTMDVDSMIYFKKDEAPEYPHRGLFFDEFEWSTAKSHGNCPRFCAKSTGISYGTVSNEEWEEIIREAEEGHYCGKKMDWDFFPFEMTMDPTLFNRFLKAFNVTKFMDQTEHTDAELDLRYLRHLKSDQMEDITLTTPFPIEELVGLKAPKMLICTTSERINTTINNFFTEWFFKQREIRNVRLVAYYEVVWENVNVDEIFSQLPFTLLWSPETHDSSILSELPLDIISDDNLFFYIENDSKKLSIQFRDRDMIVKEVSNAEDGLLEILDDVSFEKLTGLKKCCKTSECVCSNDYEGGDSDCDTDVA